jgi:hypothetical protein
MAFPADAKQRKLTRQFPGEDIWDLLQREMLRDVADWLREEMALRGWSYDAAQGWLETDGGHIWHIVHHRKKAGKGKIIKFAIIFGYALDDKGKMTTVRIDYLLALFGYTPLDEPW